MDCSPSRPGAVIRLWLGWSDTALVYKGTYTVDETEHSGAPDVLSIRARSADLRKGLKTKRERSWSNSTVGDVLGDIAIANDLTATIAGELDGLAVLQLDQANESDANHPRTDLQPARHQTDIDATIWYSGNVQHSLSADSGYTMSLSLESKLPEDAVAELADDSGSDYTRVIAYYRDEKTGKEKKRDGWGPAQAQAVGAFV